jgi:hypothetical protein
MSKLSGNYVIGSEVKLKKDEQIKVNKKIISEQKI